MVADTFLVRINLNTDGAEINAIEGGIEISSSGEAVKVQDISLGGSALELWPDKPSLSVEGKKVMVYFTGGTPAGFNKAEALLFTLALTTTEPEDIIISPLQLVAYASDGQGSPMAVSGDSLNLKIEQSTAAPKNEWQNFVAVDHLPPESFRITFGQDPYVAAGQKFLSFNAVDSGSGLDHYEVSEGDRPTVRSNDMYILADQTNPAAVKVVAYDKAGNGREEKWQPPQAPAVPRVTKINVIMAVIKIIGLILTLILTAILLIKLFKWKKIKK